MPGRIPTIVVCPLCDRANQIPVGHEAQGEMHCSNIEYPHHGIKIVWGSTHQLRNGVRYGPFSEFPMFGDDRNWLLQRNIEFVRDEANRINSESLGWAWASVQGHEREIRYKEYLQIPHGMWTCSGFFSLVIMLAGLQALHLSVNFVGWFSRHLRTIS